ncbi:hypothetical protein AZE42_02586 [Rhizopogon vesiculosus]|uniref:ABC transmembrane type-1 domain-containing protein n=1 Tax=Rhizopogon vesiculosus TaxID=180088 RepID=A0A1J8R5T8_9AGAM|nr:hypothetical protein AZE42_02586 [Rhizopogon vesiculosus]
MLTATASQIIGAIILISIIIPYFLVVAFFIIIWYTFAAYFYRASAPSCGPHFILTFPSQSGLTTIRAYGELERFLAENVELVDVENRAYWLTVVNQRWLGMCLYILGALLALAVALLTVGTRFTISPGQTGVVLSYILMVQLVFLSDGWFAKLPHYVKQLEQEAPHEIEDSPVLSNWPSEGKVAMKDVVMRYHPELRPQGPGHVYLLWREDWCRRAMSISCSFQTGAGKSSIMTAIYVPIQNAYSDLYDALVFFRGDLAVREAREELVANIAREGMEWSLTFWREDDMVAYLFSWCLEYGRVMSEDRNELNFELEDDR